MSRTSRDVHDRGDGKNWKWLTVSGHCVMQSTKYSLKIKQIHGEWNKWKIRGPSKSAPPSAGLQQTIKLKLKKTVRM